MEQVKYLQNWFTRVQRHTQTQTFLTKFLVKHDSARLFFVTIIHVYITQAQSDEQKKEEVKEQRYLKGL